MFTGIITGVGQIVDSQALGADASHGRRLTLQTPAGYLDGVGLGDSIAINGACMTVTSFDAAAGRFTIDVSAESLARTVGLDQQGTVNMEQALRSHDRLGGHIVTGHVDDVGEVVVFEPVGESWLLQIRAPRTLARFLAYKGSITVNGVSLTVNTVQDATDGSTVFSINLIPHTIENTALGTLKVGSKVNLEVDLIARYVERMLGAEGKLAP
ncbi:MAG: riboflavin synthase [Aquabacterium sp.]|jgi:riboflavin synthase|uniref:riboflavin synthase n=1 Tax=Aquabacterium sp. TaxID=1872578 RepID=UPI001B611C99|nr:riboflavin synthase [Aquabacterium sp.]MBP7132145.1 riboflavin synthase [Aquabacterium sp.]MDQ5926596.1 riboflavin synthase [Pseudomonadota bacterium]